ncbi:hypothetical protein B0H17DRAFT_1213959 [Mycena rosella]|uniref:Uncharacterized protein n=1 Tax=Mycena rosella TaxID=1033263 RepID=A0AAD7G4L0_MYCRO|nr:hypothetical protein B0H17DRAFT_1213959 [Mycena rosella]
MWPLIIGLVSGVCCSAQSSLRASLASSSPPPPRTPASPPRATSASPPSPSLISSPPPSPPSPSPSTSSPLRPAPWVSLADTHFDFGRVGQVPHFLWAVNASSRVVVELTRWASPVCALVFFGFFEVRGGGAPELMGCSSPALAALFGARSGRFRRQAPCVGFLAATPTAAGHAKFSPTSKPPPASPPHSKQDISLPAYSSFSGTGLADGLVRSTHGGTELKRTESQLRPSPLGHDPGGLVAAGGRWEGAGGEGDRASAYTLEAVTPTTAYTLEAVTPTTASSHASYVTDSTAPASPYAYALPLHAGGRTAHIPQRGFSDEDGGEEAQWSHASDAHSVQLDVFPTRGGTDMLACVMRASSLSLLLPDAVAAAARQTRCPADDDERPSMGARSLPTSYYYN